MHTAVCRIVCVLLGSAIWAQTAGVISGTVRDATGAPLSGVRVTVTHMGTGFARETTSRADGWYAVPNLAGAVYRVQGEKAGFTTTVLEGLDLAVGAALTADLALNVGAVETKVTVTAAGDLVNTQTAELSYLVGERAMRELPLNGRNYTDLALLQPGVTAFPHRDGGSVVAHGLAMSINGQDPRSNTYLLDGTIQNDFTNGPAGSAAGTVLGLETIREFRVEANAYSAEFGRNMGGQINALTKSGANALSGSAYYFHRNSAMDARNFFDRAGKPSFKRHQGGGALGGPVRKDKTFYFLSYETLHDKLGRTINTFVPDANARNGILPDGPVTIAASVKPFVAEYPMPNGAATGGGIAGLSFPFLQDLNDHYGMGRIDHHFSSRNQAFARFSINDTSLITPTDYPQFPRTFLSRTQFLTLEDRWIQSAATSHTFRGSFSRTRIGQDVEANTAQKLPEFIQGRGMVGSIDIGGFPRFGPQSSVNVKLVQNVYGFEYGVVHLRGRQMIKAGLALERYQDNMYNPTFGLGIFTFDNLRAFLEGRATRFIGLPPGGALDRYWRFTELGLYVQDDIRVLSRLTLNLGLRYEHATMPVDLYGRDSALPDLYGKAPVVGQLYENPNRANWSPRAGFAWDVSGDHKTSLRGGYAMFFNTNNQQHLIVTVTNPPATPRVIISAPAFPNPDFSRGVGNSMRPIQYDIRAPRNHVFNLTLQRQLPFDSVLTVGYAGARGRNLWRNSDWNTAVPTQLANGAYYWAPGSPRRNTAFGTIEYKTSDGNSWYNAMIVEGRKRFGRGVSVQTSYTFSRNIDTTQASTFFSDATNGTTNAMPELPGFNYNKGLADYHAKHNWVTNFIWMLPGRGLVRGGWQVSGIISARSGMPLTLFESSNRSRSLWAPSLNPGSGVDRPSMAPGRTYESAILGSPDRWFDPAAFALQPAGTLGTLGRGALIGPNLRATDASLTKNFAVRPLGETGNLQFRVEAFNLFNRANFGVPALLAFAGARDGESPVATLGQVRNTVTTSRQIQMGLRLTF